MNIKLLANDRIFRNKPLKLHEYAERYQLDGIEFSLNDHRIPVNKFYRAMYFSRFKEFNLYSFHLPFLDIEVASRDAVTAQSSTLMLKSYFQILKLLEPAYLNLHVATDAYEDEVDPKIAIANIKELVKVATDYGLVLCVENVRRGITSVPQVYKEIVAESGAKATIDIGHARGSDYVLETGTDPMEFIRGIEDRIVTAHVYSFEDDRGHHPITNLAEVEGFLTAFLANGVENWVLEHHTEADFAVTLEAVRGWLQGQIGIPEAAEAN
ncbi:MAG TPA: TIM barrel protein [Firmicutes bacterium]|jgi:sugar phosphate isomerase/epimerase|nr:TIM barrel protein [Bacillota bacterium]